MKYSLSLGKGLIEKIGDFIPQDLRDHVMIIVTDNHVQKMHADLLISSLKRAGHDPKLIAIPSGEKYKTRQTKEKIETFLLQNQCGRDTCLLAFGGGVVGDLAGFTAATYMRGIPYIQIPTTLLAMLDSSVGGKTGVNTPEGKNLIGAFWEPRAVIGDLDLLETLPEQHKVNGWIEALKIFLIRNKDAFNQAAKDHAPSLDLIRHAIMLKGEIVEQDPYELNLRAILNFGHTIGHAIEKITDYKILHGYAVGYGILVEAQISRQRGLISSDDFLNILNSMGDLGLCCKEFKNFDADSIVNNCVNDKKNKNQQIRMVLLSGVGQAYIDQGQCTHAVSENEIHQGIEAVRGVWDERE